MNHPDQLPLYEVCCVCRRVVYSYASGAPVPFHRACHRTVGRWFFIDGHVERQAK